MTNCNRPLYLFSVIAAMLQDEQVQLMIQIEATILQILGYLTKKLSCSTPTIEKGLIIAETQRSAIAKLPTNTLPNTRSLLCARSAPRTRRLPVVPQTDIVKITKMYPVKESLIVNTMAGVVSSFKYSWI